MNGTNKLCMLVLVILAAIVAILFIWGCSRNMNSASAITARQRAVQDCILSGKQPVAGPGNIILCE
jgi:TRAP-type C4-dicarboxylate transport system permease small subunit